MKKVLTIVLSAIVVLSLFVPALAAPATDLTGEAKVATVIEMYSQQLPIVRLDAQFMAAPDYLNSAADEGWKDPGTGTRSINIDGVPEWKPYFNDDFLYEIDDGFASFDYPCIWSNIPGPMRYSFTVDKDDIYEFVIVGAAQITEANVDNDAKDRGFSISVDGGDKVQVNISDTLAAFRSYTYTYDMKEEQAAQIKTTNGVNSQNYQMCYIYNIEMPLTKGEHVFEYWHLEYSGENNLSEVNGSRLNYAGAYVQRALSEAELAAYTYPEITTVEVTTPEVTTAGEPEVTTPEEKESETQASPEPTTPVTTDAKPVETTKPAESTKKGCGGFAGAGVVLVAILGTAIVSKKRR